MRVSHWLRPLGACLNPVRNRRRPRTAFRPRVEGLEDRCLLSVTPYLFDKSAFLAATGATSATGHLPNLGRITEPVANPMVTIGSVTFNIAGLGDLGTNSLFVGGQLEGGPPGGDWYPLRAGNEIALSGTENLNVDLAAPVYSFGFDFVEPNATTQPWTRSPIDSTFTVTLMNGGSVVGSFDFNAPDDVITFVGVTAGTPFNHVEIREVVGGGDDEYFGEFYTGGNSPPAAFLRGPYSVAEGGTLMLDATSSSDPDGDPLSYSWDVNGDGVFGDATGVSPTLTWSQLNALGVADGPSSFNVRVRVSDGVNDPVTSAATTLTVTNTAPAVTIGGPGAAVPGQPLTYTFTAGDPSPVDQASAFTYAIDWDCDGIADQTVSGPAVVQLTHTYSTTGDYSVRATATDKDGGVGPAASLPVTITHALMEGNDLVVGGTPGNDHIQFTPAGSSGGVAVSLDGGTLGTFYPAARLVAYGGDGDDDIQVASGISLPAWLYGGDGNDRLKGGGGNNVLLGGAGDDLLVGGNDRDVLIGGAGADRIVGNAADDILVSGSTAFDGNEAALAAVLAEWASGRSYSQRVANVSGQTTAGADNSTFASRGNGDYFLRVTGLADTTTVYDDGAADVLTGSSGQDWFFANLGGGGVLDRITDLSAAEFANDLTFILS